ncbi:MAG: hypothetical protein U9Q62_09255 [Campylobacterota bacterium]|nr:hypothetical protein [Campylobacterota bacterium]
MNTPIRAITLMLISTLLWAAPEADKEKTELKKVMKSFASALELIQHGILYNKTDEMHKGAQRLRNSEHKFLQRHGDALVRHMPDNPEFAQSYAKSTAKRIRNYTDRLNYQLGTANDYSQIATTYNHVLQECVGCHQKIRQW